MTTAIKSLVLGAVVFGCADKPPQAGVNDAGPLSMAQVSMVAPAFTPDTWTKQTFEAYLAYQRKMEAVEDAFSRAFRKWEETDAGEVALEALERREFARARVLQEVGLGKDQRKALEATLGPLLAQRSAEEPFNLSEAQKGLLEALMAKLPDKRRKELESALKEKRHLPLETARTLWGDSFVQLYLQYERALKEQDEALSRARFGP